MIQIGYIDYMRKEPPGSKIFRPNGSGDYLFLYFPLPMHYYAGDDYTLTKKNACVFLAPHDAHRFSGAPEFLNTFVHFSYSEQDEGKFPIPTNRIFYPSDFERMNDIVMKIRDEQLIGGELYEEMSHALMMELLILARRSFSNQHADPLKSQFENLRYELLSDCSRELSAAELASRVCMSRTQFYEYYKRFFSSSPKQDLLKARMEKAAVLLTNRLKTVSDVAEEVGFENIEHFTRYYSKYFGHPPRRNKNTDKTSS